MDDFYEHHHASVHRGVYPLAVEATELFEGARDRVAALRRLARPRTTIFTENATEAINLVAHSWGRANLGPGDRVVVTEMEHHSMIVPWHMLCRRARRPLRRRRRRRRGPPEARRARRAPREGPVKLVAVVARLQRRSARSTRSRRSSRRAHAAGALVLVDGSQAVPQIPVDVGAIDADFYAWTGHKAYGPTGIGVLHGRPSVLDAMPPFIGGGHMISTVSFDEIRFGRGCPRSSRRARRRSPRRSASAPPSTSLDGLGMDASARTSASSSPTRSSASPRSRA